QGFVDRAGVSRVNKRPSGIDPVIDPILVPSAGQGNEVLRKRSLHLAVKSFELQAAVDTDINIRLHHRDFEGRLLGGGDGVIVTAKNINGALAHVPWRASVQHLDLVAIEGSRRVADFPVLGALYVRDWVDDAVDGLVVGFHRSKKSAGAADE